MKIRTFKIDSALWEAFQVQAEHNYQSASARLRMLIEQDLKKNPPAKRTAPDPK
jgi:hypothetical protein